MDTKIFSWGEGFYLARVFNLARDFAFFVCVIAYQLKLYGLILFVFLICFFLYSGTGINKYFNAFVRAARFC